MGFRVTHEEPGRVVLTSDKVSVVATASPRGEVEVTAMPVGAEWPLQWSWSGMVGHADVERLFELALERMQTEPQALSGDEGFYQRMADKNEAESRALNSQAQGGPSPARDPRRLP